MVVSSSSNLGRAGAAEAKEEKFETSQLLDKVALLVLELFKALIEMGFLVFAVLLLSEAVNGKRKCL